MIPFRFICSELYNMTRNNFNRLLHRKTDNKIKESLFEKLQYICKHDKKVISEFNKIKYELGRKPYLDIENYVFDESNLTFLETIALFFIIMEYVNNSPDNIWANPRLNRIMCSHNDYLEEKINVCSRLICKDIDELQHKLGVPDGTVCYTPEEYLSAYIRVLENHYMRMINNARSNNNRM